MWENLNQLLYILEALMLLNGCDMSDGLWIIPISHKVSC